MISVAAIGTSMITTRFIDAVRMADGVTVTTIFSRDPARAAAFAQEVGVGATSSDIDALLAAVVEHLDPVIAGVRSLEPEPARAGTVARLRAS